MGNSDSRAVDLRYSVCMVSRKRMGGGGMIPVTLNRQTVKMSQNEARDAQAFYSAKQRGESITTIALDWLNNAPNVSSKDRRKEAIQKFNLI